DDVEGFVRKRQIADMTVARLAEPRHVRAPRERVDPSPRAAGARDELSRDRVLAEADLEHLLAAARMQVRLLSRGDASAQRAAERHRAARARGREFRAAPAADRADVA